MREPIVRSKVFALLPVTPQDIADALRRDLSQITRALYRLGDNGDAHIARYVEGPPNRKGVCRWRPLWVRGAGEDAARPANPVAAIGRGLEKQSASSAGGDLAAFFHMGGWHDGK